MKINLLLTTVLILTCTSSEPLATPHSTQASHLHNREATDPFDTAVCRGIRLSWAMQLPSTLASQFLTPIDSPFANDLRDALHHWGYTEVPVQGYLCDFDTTHHLETAFRALGVDPRSERRGGPNRCFHVEHQYKDHPAPVGQQAYWVDGTRYRMTGAHFTIGVNPVAGIVYFLNRRSARNAARMYWGRGTPLNEQLPALRSGSDVAWGFYYRVNWGRLGNVRAFMSMMVVNTDTVRIIERALVMYNEKLPEGHIRVNEVQPWPGTTFDVDDIEGQALLATISKWTGDWVLPGTT